MEKIDQYITEHQGQAPKLIAKLNELKMDYASRAKLTKAKSTTFQQVLDEINAANTNPMESASAKFTSFLKSMGLHLIGL